MHPSNFGALSRLLSDRQSQCECAPFPRLAHHLDGAAVGINDGLCDSQTQASASLDASARFVGSPKALEYVREIVLGNAQSAISNGENGFAIIFSNRNANIAALAIVVNCIGQEIRDDQPKAINIA